MLFFFQNQHTYISLACKLPMALIYTLMILDEFYTFLLPLYYVVLAYFRKNLARIVLIKNIFFLSLKGFKLLQTDFFNQLVEIVLWYSNSL